MKGGPFGNEGPKWVPSELLRPPSSQSSWMILSQSQEGSRDPS